MAAHDKGTDTDSKGLYKCRGCLSYYHEDLQNGAGDLNDWRKSYTDPYPLLIAFGVILGVFWWITGLIGAVAKKTAMDKLVKYIQ